jgi:hypothetical protein
MIDKNKHHLMCFLQINSMLQFKSKLGAGHTCFEVQRTCTFLLCDFMLLLDFIIWMLNVTLTLMFGCHLCVPGYYVAMAGFGFGKRRKTSSPLSDVSRDFVACRLVYIRFPCFFCICLFYLQYMLSLVLFSN